MIIQINDCASVNSKNVASVEVKTYINTGGNVDDKFQSLIPLFYKKIYSYEIFIVVNSHEILFDEFDFDVCDNEVEKVKIRLEKMYKKAIKLMKKIIKEADK